MISAYKIGVEIALTGNISKIISDLTKQFDGVNAAIKRVQESVTNLEPAMNRLRKSGMETANAWREAAVAMERAARTTPPGGSGGGGGGGGGSSALRLGGPAAAAGLALGVAGGAGGGNGGGGYNGPLRLTGPGSPGGGGGGGGNPPRPPRNPMNSHDYAMAAAGFGALGYGIFHAEGNAIEAAGEVSHLRAILIGQGVAPGAADDAIEQARKVAISTPGITIAKALESVLDLKSVLGGTSQNPASVRPALSALPAFAKTMSLLNAIGKQKGDPTFAAAKAQELLGHLVDEKTGGISSEELQKHLDATGQVALATNNRVGPSDYLSFVKQARLAGILANDDFLYKEAPALIMEMGGSRAGTGAAAFSRQFLAGTMTKAKFAELQKLGVYDRGAKWDGGHVIDSEKHLSGGAGASANPAEWVWNTLIPLLDKAGIHDRLGQAKAVAQFASTAVGGGFISSLITQEAGIKKEAANIGAAQKGGAALGTMYNQDFTLQVSNFQSAFHNLMTDLGQPMLKDAAELLRLTTSGMNQLGEWAHKYPDVAHRIEEFATAVALFAVGTAAYSGLMFLGGPMLRVAQGIAGFATAAAGISLTGASGSLLGWILTRFAGPAGVVAGIMSPSATNVGEDKFLRDHKEMSPDELKASLDPKNWVPPNRTGKPVQLQGNVILDGKKVGSIMADGMADHMSKPATGGNSPDGRVTPFMPGMLGIGGF